MPRCSEVRGGLSPFNIYDPYGTLTLMELPVLSETATVLFRCGGRGCRSRPAALLAVVVQPGPGGAVEVRQAVRLPSTVTLGHRQRVDAKWWNGGTRSVWTLVRVRTVMGSCPRCSTAYRHRTSSLIREAHATIAAGHGEQRRQDALQFEAVLA